MLSTKPSSQSLTSSLVVKPPHKKSIDLPASVVKKVVTSSSVSEAERQSTVRKPSHQNSTSKSPSFQRRLPPMLLVRRCLCCTPLKANSTDILSSTPTHLSSWSTRALSRTPLLGSWLLAWAMPWRRTSKLDSANTA